MKNKYVSFSTNLQPESHSLLRDQWSQKSFDIYNSFLFAIGIPNQATVTSYNSHLTIILITIVPFTCGSSFDTACSGSSRQHLCWPKSIFVYRRDVYWAQQSTRQHHRCSTMRFSFSIVNPRMNHTWQLPCIGVFLLTELHIVDFELIKNDWDDGWYGMHKLFAECHSRRSSVISLCRV